jgi:cell division protein FtsL
MSRAAATAAGRARTGERAAPTRPRRVSGPAHPAHPATRPRAVPGRRAPTHRSTGALLVERFVVLADAASTSRWMDRLVRGRAWVVVIAFALIGIVAMQVSLLQMNTGIGRAVKSAATLERHNSALRVQVSRLGSGERIQQVAADRGLVMPPPGDVRYLRSGDLRADARRAARSMRASDPAAVRHAEQAAQQGAAAGAQSAIPDPPAAQAPAPVTPQASAPAPAPQAATPPAPTPTPAPEPATAAGPAGGAQAPVPGTAAP